MAGRKLTNGIKYSVVGRYMTGSTVSGYHLLGEDESQVAVPKDQLIYLVGKGIISNCRVQMYNNSALLRGKGINLQELPVYDETRQQMKNTQGMQNIGGVKPKSNDPNSVFGQLAIKMRIMHGNACIGYVVENAAGTTKRLSRAKVMEMAAEKQIGNARVQKSNDKILLRGVGIELDKLPVIYVDTNGKDIDPKIIEAAKKAEQETSKHIASVISPVKIEHSKKNDVLTISQEELINLGKKKMVLNKGVSTLIPGQKRSLGITDVKSKEARIYIQIYPGSKENGNMEEFISTDIKFGTKQGVIVRMTNRKTNEIMDIKEVTLPVESIKERIIIGIVCCGILKKYNKSEFGLMSIQANNASAETAFEFAN